MIATAERLLSQFQPERSQSLEMSNHQPSQSNDTQASTAVNIPPYEPPKLSEGFNDSEINVDENIVDNENWIVDHLAQIERLRGAIASHEAVIAGARAQPKLKVNNVAHSSGAYMSWALLPSSPMTQRTFSGATRPIATAKRAAASELSSASHKKGRAATMGSRTVSFPVPLANKYDILGDGPLTAGPNRDSSSMGGSSGANNATNTPGKPMGAKNKVKPVNESSNTPRDCLIQQQQVPKPIKPAPVIATHTSSRIVMHKIANCKKTDGSDIRYSVRIRGEDVMINPTSIEDREAIIKCLKDSGAEFYTHAQKKAGLFVSILRGLPPVDTKEVVDALTNEYDLTPDLVIGIPTWSTTSQLFRVEFSQPNMKQNIAEMKYLACHRISWERPKKKSTGPTTCHNCAMHGHGKSGCHRGAVCVFCGAGHTLADCELIDTENAIPSCAHCAARDMEFHHRADDSGCPHLIEYINRRSRPKKTLNKPTHIAHANSGAIAAPSRQRRRFSSPSPVRRTDSSALGASSYADVIHGHKRAPARSGSPGRQSAHSSHYQAGVNKSGGNSGSLDMLNTMFNQQEQLLPADSQQLMSNQQVFAILLQAIDQLRRCRTRLDQAAVIAHILSQCQ